MKRGSLGLAVVGLAIVVAVGLAVWMLQTRAAGEGARVTAPRTGTTSESALPTFADAGAAARPIAAIEPVPGAAEPTPASQAEAPGLATLRVTVLNPDQAPLPDATVWLKTAPLKLLRTGADGAVAITGDFGAEVDVAARHPDFRFGFAHATLPARGEPPAEAIITLTAELTACLRVEDERGGAIEGASVSVREFRTEDTMLRNSLIATPDQLTSQLSRDLFKGVFDETRLTGADGRCCVAGITAGRVMVDVRAPGYVWASHRTYAVGPRGGDLGVVTLTPAQVLHGTVVDAQGPVPDAVVETNTGGRDIGGYTRVVTDANGEFTLDTLQAKLPRIPLLVTHPTRGDFLEVKLTLTPDPVTIVLRPSFDLTLLPRDAATKVVPAGPCTVTRFLPWEAFPIRSGQPVKLPVESGAAHVGWVPYYATGVQVEVPGYARTVVDMARIDAAAGAPVEVDLVNSGTIALHVIDGATGQPLSGIDVGASRLDPKQIGSYWRVEAPWDEAAGAWMLDTSQFTFAAGVDEAFYVNAPGHKGSKTTVSANGVRVCGPVVDITLQVDGKPKPK